MYGNGSQVMTKGIPKLDPSLCYLRRPQPASQILGLLSDGRRDNNMKPPLNGNPILWYVLFRVMTTHPRKENEHFLKCP